MDPNEAGIFSEPPELTVKTDRTHCERCKQPISADAFHSCPELCKCGLPNDGHSHAFHSADDEDHLP
jgi:hypothetical protein